MAISTPAGLSQKLNWRVFILGGHAVKYTKPFRSYDEQTDLLIRRGMLADRDILISHLQDVGYYRLSGYWHIFKCQDDTFQKGTNFAKTSGITDMKLLVLDAHD